MILHPGILALLLGSSIVFLMMLYASGLGLRIVARWDYESASEGQMILERKTYLVSTLMNYALGFEILSTLLFIYTVDELHPLFVGAMCATGALNVNPVGWSVLYTKIFVFFIASLWISLNHFDQRAEDYPLVKIKYLALLLITPLVGLDLFLQVSYFLGIHPEIITSCCGSLFSEGGTNLAGELAGLPVTPMMWGFYGMILLFFAAASVCLISESGAPRYILSALAVLSFFTAIAAMISFISLYIYELPTHHCPFDILQKHYSFIGYPIYISLFCAVLFGVLPGLFHPLKRISTLNREIKRAEKQWLILAMVSLLIFVAISSWSVIFGNFTMAGYS